MSVGGYNGNPNLPKGNSKYQITPYMLEEMRKCIDDPIYFAETYFKIVHVDDGLIPFKLYEYQKEAIKLASENRKFVMNASRQCGKTSVATVIILHYALFNKNKKIGLLANKADTAQEILSRIQLAYEYLPHWLKCGVVEWNKRRVEFDNGTIIMAAASSASSIRGQSLAMLYLDECAFVENFEEFSASVMPTLSSGKHTRMIFTSTPNGLNHFYYYCDGAKNGTNGFSYLEVPWYRVPGRDEKWKQETLGTINNDLQKFETEYACAFEGSSGTLISGAALKTLRPKVPLHLNPGYGYRVYAAPEPGKSYVIVVDVSRGKGLDYSAFHVIDVSDVPYRQVATFKNNMITPIDYAEYIYRTAIAYNSAYVLVEINDIGGQVSDLLYFDYGYESVIHTENHGRSGKRVSGGFCKNIDRGIRTTKSVKALGCSMLKLLIEQKKLIVVDKDTIGELGVFSKKGTSYEAEPGHNDDLVMGLVLFGWLTQDSFFKEMNDTDIMHHLREQNEDDIVENLVSFGFRYDATDEYDSGTYEKLDDGGWWAKAGL